MAPRCLSGNAPSTWITIRSQGRLRRRKDFDAIYRRGRSWNNELLVLRTLSNDLSCNRVGFVISKRVGNAVVRNRVRRRLKETIRPMALSDGWDILFSAKATAAGAKFEQLRSSAISLLTRSELLGAGSKDPLP